MYSDGPGTRAMFTGVRDFPARSVGAIGGCDCLDWRVHGHVCATLAPPSQSESNAWRDIPGLRDPAPRPEPAPGDWLPGQLRRRDGDEIRTMPVTGTAAA
jgi:hypothetical protein